MKRTILYVFIGLLLLSVVAWVIQPKPSTDGKIPLVWCTDDNPVRREQYSLFNKQNKELSLSLDPKTTIDKIIVQAIAGVGPDLFDCHTIAEFPMCVKSGIAWDVTDEFKKAGIDVMKDQWPVMRPYFLYKGRVYGCATNTSSNAIWFNKDIFDKYHEPYPKGDWTWDQFIPVAQRLTIRDKRGRATQFGFIFDIPLVWQQFIWQWGGRVFNDDGTKCIMDSPEAIAGIQFIHDLIYKYRVSPNPVEEQAASQGGWGSGSITLFGANRSAMANGGRWWLCSLRGYEGLRLGAVQSPYSKHKIFYGYGKSTLVNKNSPHRKEALKYLIYLNSQGYNELINSTADGLAPVKKFSYTDKYLHDPKYPNEDYNAVWRDIMNFAKPDETSPFVQLNIVQRIVTKQLDLVKTNQKSSADAMRTAAKQINEEIQKSLAEDPALKARYDKLIAARGSR